MTGRVEQRVPETLQAVILASNRGKQVDQAPPHRVASKSFSHDVKGRASSSSSPTKHPLLLEPTFWKSHHSSASSVNTSYDGHEDDIQEYEDSFSSMTPSFRRRPSPPVSLFSPCTRRSPSFRKQRSSLRRVSDTESVVSSASTTASTALHSFIDSQCSTAHDTSHATEQVANTSSSQPKDAMAPASEIIIKPIPMSPYEYFVRVLKERGYPTQTYPALESGYAIQPTPLQMASYDVFLIGLARTDQPDALLELLDCGLSPNPCNRYAESLVHTVARVGNHTLLRALLKECGTTIQVCDDYGRTPLHDAFWAAQPSFPTVELILEYDIQLLFLVDARGHVPLQYVRQDHWGLWNAFLQEKVLDLYFPVVPHRICRMRTITTTTPYPELLQRPKERRQLRNPLDSLPIEFARLVASGRITAEEARLLTTDSDENEDDDDDSTSYWDSDDPSFNSSGIEIGDFSITEEDEEAEYMASLLKDLQSMMSDNEKLKQLVGAETTAPDPFV